MDKKTCGLMILTTIVIVFAILSYNGYSVKDVANKVLNKGSETSGSEEMPVYTIYNNSLDYYEEEDTEEMTNIEKAELIVSNMTLEEKVGQMFFVRCPETNAAKVAADYKLGAYILFARDFENKTKEQVKKNIESYQQAANYPMLIGVDEEGGTVTRVSRYTEFRSEKFKSPQNLYQAGGMELILSDSDEKCALLSSLGINVNFAPVCDVSTSETDYMYSRTFGKSASDTADYITQIVNNMNNNNMGSVLKHFPGYGNNVDTHTGVAIDTREYNEFEECDFLPFIAGFDAKAGSVLVSHNIVNCMDSQYPASLSEKVHKIIREELGYEGVIMTDDLEMDAIRQYTGDEQAAVFAVKAGNDMIVITDYETQIPAVIKAVKSNEISIERIEESAVRVINWKIELGIIQ